jgi:hypothetical protein
MKDGVRGAVKDDVSARMALKWGFLDYSYVQVVQTTHRDYSRVVYVVAVMVRIAVDFTKHLQIRNSRF